MVTGATSGFGEAAALHLAHTGFDVCVVARDRERAERVCDEIARTDPDATTEVVIADLSAIDDVRAAAEQVVRKDRPVRLLLNNAGAMFGLRRRQSIDGIEMTMALNHFAYHQLTTMLLDRVLEAQPSRIINVASDAYSFAGGRFDFDDWPAETGYRPHRQYGRSKLANILFTLELAERTRETEVRVVAWSPTGLTATRFGHGANRLAPLAMKLTRPFSLSTENAVQGLLELCDRPISAAEHGGFFLGHDIAEVEVAPRDDAAQLWEMTEQILDRHEG